MKKAPQGGAFFMGELPKGWSEDHPGADRVVAFVDLHPDSSACRTSRLKFKKALLSLGVHGTLRLTLPAEDCNRPCFPPHRNDHPFRTSRLIN
ncbi:hypothetical protein [Dechloromonas denitrificans]|uniref:hypothetical protein n=1 Tax=Dechloromonas denitrificans TaxID=281362 RepID=UPI0012FC66E0|nr:hypothetical protein [Dechloromonas denitrificans]